MLILMHLKSCFLGVLLAVFVKQSVGDNICFEAKTCLHNGKEKCGEEETGKVRRFLDSCDIKEYNCLKGTFFVKTDPAKCKDLPPIDEPAKIKRIRIDDGDEELPNTQKPPRTLEPGVVSVINEYWCWRGKDCRPDPEKACGRDRRRNQYQIFRNVCQMYKHNCHFGHDFTATSDEQCQKLL